MKTLLSTLTGLAAEFWRCYRASRTLAAQPAPVLPRTPTLRMTRTEG